MNALESSLLIFFLIATSAFFAISEISLAAARKLKLEQLLEEGDARAANVILLQEKPGYFFTAVQIGLNTVAILAGVVGEGAYAPVLSAFFNQFTQTEVAETLGSVTSFVVVTKHRGVSVVHLDRGVRRRVGTRHNRS